jgi:hypothetical protein
MSNRPTPETDAAASPHIGFYSCATVTANFARRLEIERDEARAGREAYKQLAVKHAQDRDEAREELEEYRSIAENIGADKAVSEKEKAIRERNEALNKMADALQEVDLRTLDFERMKQERDEAREEAHRFRSLHYSHLGINASASAFPWEGK